mmetsp:Transcript_10433/g.34595  ORF Transcript_10433/g.34595 Transcript_10433/m.34595 type:complete len:336 (+) Transcript_10433:756-1763(+)
MAVLSLLCSALSATAEVSVRLARLLPMMPVVSPDARAQRVLQFDAAVAPAQLAWVPRSDFFTGMVGRQRSVDRLSFLLGDAQWAWTEGGSPEQLQPNSMVEAHSVSSPAELTCFGGQQVYSRDVDSGGVTVTVSLPDLCVHEAVALSGNRLLLAATDGRLLLLEQDDGQEGLGGIGSRPPEWQLIELASGLENVGGMCVSSNERALYLSVGCGVLRAPMVEGRLEATPAPFASTVPLPAGALATDVQQNLYVCTEEGVKVFDDVADELLSISTPSAASGVCFGCFGGSTLSTLFVGSGDSIWAVPTQVQGAEASRSFKFLKNIEKQVQAQRHDGW